MRMPAGCETSLDKKYKDEVKKTWSSQRREYHISKISKS
jgi:hypothetical protein